MTIGDKKIKSVELEVWDRLRIVFNDGNIYYLDPDEIKIASVIGHFVNEKAARFARG